AVLRGARGSAGAIGCASGGASESASVHPGILRRVPADRLGDLRVPVAGRVSAAQHNQSSPSGESTMIYRSLALLSLVLGNAFAANSLKLTLPEAVRMALAQNRALKIARLKVVENEHR